MNLPGGNHPADPPLLKCTYEAQSMNTMPGEGDHFPRPVTILATLASCTLRCRSQRRFFVGVSKFCCRVLRGDFATCFCPTFWNQEIGGHALLKKSYHVTLCYIVQIVIELATVFLSASDLSQSEFPCSPRIGLTGALPLLICHVFPKFPAFFL